MARLCGWLVLSLLISSLAAQTTPGVPQNVVVIRHATVIDATGAPARPDMKVTIIGDHIASIAKSSKAALPEGAQVIDAAGKFLIPGLWDMHVHPTGKDYLPLFIANGVTGIRIMWGFPNYFEWRKQIESRTIARPTHLDSQSDHRRTKTLLERIGFREQ
jgi:hypothetical protein